jgi:acyl carrier protein
MFKTIKEILVSKLGIEEELIQKEAFLEKNLELDSTETVVIALELKRKFGVEYKFPIEDITLGELEEHVSDLVK